MRSFKRGRSVKLAQAIQGAFNGQRAPAVRLNGSTAKSLPSPDPGEIPAELDGAEVFEDAGAAVTAPTPARPKAQKKIRTPNLDADLNPEADPSFRAYADARNVTAATSVLKKFLIVASWLHEERSGMPITADRACFRFIGWPCNIDFDQPLRDLKAKNKFVEQKPEHKGKGEFSLTHLGLDKATRMRVAS
jgi:hypothetical protein